MQVRALAPLMTVARARAPGLWRLTAVSVSLGLVLGIAGAAQAAGPGPAARGGGGGVFCSPPPTRPP